MSEKYILKTAEVLVKLIRLLNLKLKINSYSSEFTVAIRQFGVVIHLTHIKQKIEKDKYTF